jgi:protein TonB
MQAAHPWAVGGSIMAHALIAAWLWLTPEPEQTGAVTTGSGGLAVAMGPAGSTAGATAPTELPAADAVDVAEEVPAVQDVPTSVDEAPVVKAEDVPVESLPNETVPTEVPDAEPLPPDAVPAQEVAAVEPPDPEPVQVEEVVAAEPIETRLVARTPPPPTRRPPRPRPPRPEPPAEQAVAQAAPAPAGTGSGSVGNTSAPDAGSGDASQGGGQVVGDLQNYNALLAGWLERHKEYPRIARLRGQEGTVVLQFSLDRSGRLLSWRIIQGSGYAALDRAAGAMLERAQPMPPMPGEIMVARRDFTLPVPFKLRR